MAASWEKKATLLTEENKTPGFQKEALKTFQLAQLLDVIMYWLLPPHTPSCIYARANCPSMSLFDSLALIAHLIISQTHLIISPSK